KHALTQEVAYNAVLLERRRVVHERAAQAIEGLFAERLPKHYHELAHHYSRSGNTTKAVDYLHRAGQQAVERSAYAEAASHLTTALDLLTTLPETRERSRQELAVQMTLGMALRWTTGGGTPEVEQLYTRARELCERVGEPSQLFRVLWGLWTVYGQRGEYQTLRAFAEELLILAERLQDPDLLLEAHHALWSSLVRGGELAAAQPHLEEGMRLYDPQRHRIHASLYSGHDPGVCCRNLAALSLWLRGYPDQALANMQAAMALAQPLAHPVSLALALHWAAVQHHLRREAPQTRAHADAAMTVATDQGFPQQIAQAMLLRGWALAENGQGQEGMAQIRQGLAAYQATGTTTQQPYYLALLAEASAAVGQTTEGLEALAEALATLDKSVVRWWEAELYRLRGELLLGAGGQGSGVGAQQLAQAEEWFRQALGVARRQQAKSLELRAAMSLSRLWWRQGKRADARDLLAPLYSWFTEGFATADLREAQALLQALGGRGSGRRRRKSRKSGK
ncbi:MAG: hypothetical protein HYZ81_13585, partial [Nitrospinae bacterium]|nr:hypothetical protein [Nitrospinota bacterium]